MPLLPVGQVFRTASDYDAEPEVVDGLPNYWHHTVSSTGVRAVMMRGINPLKTVGATDGKRVPVILIRSAPHKAGSATTPWQDYFDVDNGHVRYFGDAKFDSARSQPTYVDPAKAPGNAALLAAREAHNGRTAEERRSAVPILLFRAPGSGRVRFEGLGVIEAASIVSQRDPSSGRSFSNYVYDVLILDLSAEGEQLDWSWIEARADRSHDVAASNASAPSSWKTFLRDGLTAGPRIRRRVSRMITTSTAEQQPPPRSPAASTLHAIYDFYQGRKSRFEALAEVVAERVLGSGGSQYQSGWLTQAGADGGADFVGRLDVGSGFGKTKLVVLGQAKCEKLDAPTGGNHVARTVARLRRGWIGVYVTTSYFSEAVQREIYEDDYPIVLINGARIAAELDAMSYESGNSVVELLGEVDAQYEVRVGHRDPAEILHD